MEITPRYSCLPAVHRTRWQALGAGRTRLALFTSLLVAPLVGCSGSAGDNAIGGGNPDASASLRVIAEPSAPIVKPLLAHVQDVTQTIVERPRRLPHTNQAASKITEAPVMAPGVATSFDGEEGGLHPIVPPEARSDINSPVDVWYPADATGAFRLRDLTSAATLEVSLKGTEAVPAQVNGGYAVYPGAYVQHARTLAVAGAAGPGADLIQRPTAIGTEDYLYFRTAPLHPEVVYQVTLGAHLAGIRYIGQGGDIEFVDKHGTPQLRMEPAWIVGGDHQAHPAQVSVVGCKVDDNPAPPWNHPVVAPDSISGRESGIERCEIHVAWSNEAITYPAVLDPSWTSTGSMVTINQENVNGRQDFTLTTLPDGRILAAGGDDKYHDNEGIAEAEIYDPSTGKWTQTGAPVTLEDGKTTIGMNARRTLHTATLLTTGTNAGKVLIVGGIDQQSNKVTTLDTYGKNNSLQTSELYDEATGTFTWGPSLSEGRANHDAVLLDNGDVLVAGGEQDYDGGTNYDLCLKTTELYSAASNTFTKLPDLDDTRTGAGMAKLSNGKVIIESGYDCAPNFTYLTSTEIYDPSTKTWSAGPAMQPAPENSTGTWEASTTVLSDGRVLVAGGYNDNGTDAGGQYLKSAQIFDGTSWTATGSMNQARYAHSATLLPCGDLVLVAGGYAVTNYLSSVEYYDPKTGTWTNTTPLLAVRAYHRAVYIPGSGARGDEVLVAGGAGPLKNDGSVPTAELFTGFKALGCSCTSQTECLSNFCVDGVCCDNSCDGSCESCNQAGKEGTCTVSPAGDPGSPSCMPYVCDGTHTNCPSGCTQNSDCTSPQVCSCTGQCVAPQANGACCKDGTQCSSTFCADIGAGGTGVCCTSACDGACDSCSQAGSVGTCTPDPKGNAGSPSCGPYVCDGTNTDCPTTCTKNSDCTSGNFCDCNHHCVATGSETNGTCCTADSQCSSNHCVDGVCCNTACDGSCDSCDQAGSVGTCTFIPKGQDGSPSCGNYVCSGSSKDCPTTCTANSDCATGKVCNCSGFCVDKQADGACCSNDSQCSSNHCADGVCCDTACDGSCDSCNQTGSVGTCKFIPKGNDGSPTCGDYVCSGSSKDCPTTCTANSDCTANDVCDCTGHCVAKTSQVNGSCCTRADQCNSGFCADIVAGGSGVCCNTACNTSCAICDGTGAPGNVKGTCGPRSSTDPGSPACKLQNCDGTDLTCPNACNNTTNPCNAGNFCDCNGECQPDGSLNLGDCCSADSQCATGHCADGVCCNTACSGDCDACNLSGTVGTCTLDAKGSPGNASCGLYVCSGSSADCPTTCTNDTDCSAGNFCDTCTNHCVAKGTQANGGCCSTNSQCQSGFCVDGICCDQACNGSCNTCNGDGQNGSAKGTCDVRKAGIDGSPSCAPYVCDGTNPTCPRDCTTNSDCSSGNVCSCNHQCVPPQDKGACCTDATQCKGGLFCADGVCCDSACGNNCDSCDLTGHLGTCTVLPQGQDGSPKCAGNLVCDGTDPTCPTRCNVDGDCDVGFFCDCNHQCVATATQAKGSCCTSDGQCATNHCVDGVCCDSACTGACASCDLPGSQGTCTAVSTPNAGTPSCQPYVCDGTNQNCPTQCSSDADCASGNFCDCNHHCVATGSEANGACCSADSQCNSGHCYGVTAGSTGICCNSTCKDGCDSCDQAGKVGTCTVLPRLNPGNNPNCGQFLCDGTSPTCPTACTDNSDCSGTNVCDCTGHCVPPQANGACCQRANQCGSGFCVDNVCCNNACETVTYGDAMTQYVCEACNVPGHEGTCTPRPHDRTNLVRGCSPYACDGTNPACPTSCVSDDGCDEYSVCCNGACERQEGIGSTCTADCDCESGHCSDGVCCDSACSGGCDECDLAGSVGTCKVLPKGNAGQNPSCGTYVCDGTNPNCPGGCASSADCATGDICNCNNKCVAPQDNGACCKADGDCSSGHCADGVCCDSACTGQCESCNQTGKAGTCSPVTGAPAGGRAACNGAGACAGTCDGTNTTTCTYPGTSTVCMPKSCSGNTATADAVCDGNGNCTPGATTQCPVGCAGDVCAVPDMTVPPDMTQGVIVGGGCNCDVGSSDNRSGAGSSAMLAGLVLGLMLFRRRRRR